MKKYVLFVFILILAGRTAIYAQTGIPSFMFRLYEDNDFLNDVGKGTDDAYTNGTRIDVFYNKDHASRFFLDRWMPQAGPNSINTFGAGLMQVMYTPSDISNKYYQPNDYAWAGALYATHTLYSYNPQQKYDIQTELLGGIMGPDAFAKPMQKVVHHLIQDPAIPQGWDNQYKNDILLNINVTAEKELLHYKDIFELIGSGQVAAGTMTGAIDVGPLIVLGKMNPYFNGYMGHYASAPGDKKSRNKLQAYLKLKPGVQFVGWNAVLQGGLFDKNTAVEIPYLDPKAPDNEQNERSMREPSHHVESVVTYLSYSVVVAYSRFSLSYTQTHTSELVKNTYGHTYGNLSATYSW